MLDMEKLTLGEIAKIEELSGASISTLGEDDTPKGKLLAALAMVAKRRDGNPGFKWNDALALSIEEANEIIGLDDDAPDDAPEVDTDKPEAKATPPAPKAGKSAKKQ